MDNPGIPAGGRGSGKTTKILKEAPQGAFFVWGTEDLRYPRELAAKLGREDLKIVGPSWLIGRRYLGLNPVQIRVDHDTAWDESTRNEWRHAQVYERTRPPSGKPVDTLAETVKEEALRAEQRGNDYLARANEAAERGDTEKAEKLYAKGQYWLDRYNTLAGLGE